MICSGCSKEIEVGGRYIIDTASSFIDEEDNPVFNDIAAMVFGASDEGKLIYCEDCTEEGGDHKFETYLPLGEQ